MADRIRVTSFTTDQHTRGIPESLSIRTGTDWRVDSAGTDRGGYSARSRAQGDARPGSGPTLPGEAMRSQTVTASKRNVCYQPYAFTEQGVAMLSSVLRSKRAVLVNMEIMRAFVRMRQRGH